MGQVFVGVQNTKNKHYRDACDGMTWKNLQELPREKSWTDSAGDPEEETTLCPAIIYSLHDKTQGNNSDMA